MSSKRQSNTDASLPFGEWLRQLRVKRDLPLRAVAAATEMDQAHLSKIELSQRLPTEEQTSKLAGFFGVNERETEARRIVEKFRQETQDNPAAAREAIYILAEGVGIYSGEKKANKGSR